LALEELYKEVILDHYKSPRNKRDLPEAERSCSKNNPLCGDEITVKAHVVDGRVAAVAFLGSGCSISQASASMMTEAVIDRPVGEALGLASDFRSFMEGTFEPDEAAFGELVALQGVVKYPVRIKCAVLAWDVLQDALTGDGEAEAAGEAAHAL
jgi:nitrogen fixation protein NifU and related proteins